MRLSYPTEAVMLSTLGSDGYGQPVLGKPKLINLQWIQHGNEVTIRSAIAIPAGTILWLGNLAGYQKATHSSTKKGINIWEVDKSEAATDVKGRVQYYGGTLKQVRSTNTPSVQSPGTTTHDPEDEFHRGEDK